MNQLLRKLVDKLAALIMPVIVAQMIIVLEELLKIDLNKDGLIGEPENDNSN